MAAFSCFKERRLFTPCNWCLAIHLVHIVPACSVPSRFSRAPQMRRLFWGLLEFRAPAQPMRTATVGTVPSRHRRQLRTALSSGGSRSGRRLGVSSLANGVATDVSRQDECGLAMSAERVAAAGEAEYRRRRRKHPLKLRMCPLLEPCTKPLCYGVREHVPFLHSVSHGVDNWPNTCCSRILRTQQPSTNLACLVSAHLCVHSAGCVFGLPFLCRRRGTKREWISCPAQ